MRFETSGLLLAVMLGGCGGESVGEPPCTATGRTYASVVTFATFAEQRDDGSVEGVNVDGIVSDGTDEAGCFKADAVGSDGATGIDNQVATLLPLVKGLVGEENIDALLGAAIKNGQLIVMTAMRGVDDLVDDACVDVAFGAGLGSPLVDGDGNYFPFQTFAWDAEAARVSTLYRARIEGGVLRAGPGDVDLPVRVLDANFTLGIHSTGVAMKVTPTPDGRGATLSGFVGGGIVVEELAKVVASFNIGESVKGAVIPLLKTRADLGMDGTGECRQISAALRFETTPSFVLDE
ncbi:MAG: hypothetical protein FJ096_20265 [Deltaproteobacteria bacterium]|nr:hypothetical protein [Deltaproteobacteria bacterium]